MCSKDDCRCCSLVSEVNGTWELFVDVYPGFTSFDCGLCLHLFPESSVKLHQCSPKPKQDLDIDTRRIILVFSSWNLVLSQFSTSYLHVSTPLLSPPLGTLTEDSEEFTHRLPSPHTGMKCMNEEEEQERKGNVKTGRERRGRIEGRKEIEGQDNEGRKDLMKERKCRTKGWDGGVVC